MSSHHALLLEIVENNPNIWKSPVVTLDMSMFVPLYDKYFRALLPRLRESSLEMKNIYDAMNYLREHFISSYEERCAMCNIPTIIMDHPITNSPDPYDNPVEGTFDGNMTYLAEVIIKHYAELSAYYS